MLIGLFVIVGRVKYCEENSIENEIVGRFIYKMRICTKYHLFHKSIMKTITNNNLP